MKVIDSGDVHELPKLQVELTGDELNKIVVSLEGVARMLEREDLFSMQHKAEHYRFLAQKLDDGYAQLIYTPRTHAIQPEEL